MSTVHVRTMASRGQCWLGVRLTKTSRGQRCIALRPCPNQSRVLGHSYHRKTKCLLARGDRMKRVMLLTGRAKYCSVAFSRQ